MTKKTFPFLNITVFELKKEKAGISAFLQAVRYCKGIKTYLDEKKPNIQFKLDIVLSSKEIDIQSDFVFLLDLIKDDYESPSGMLSSLYAYSFKYDIDGIIFKKVQGYNLSDKGF